MKLSTVSSVLACAPAVFAHPTKRNDMGGAKPNITDADILQYALTLEHLEDTFYRQGLANFTLEHFKEAGYDETFYKNIMEVSYDESTHVQFLTTALTAAGAKPVMECTYNFPVTSVSTFIATASLLEGVGVSAYLGAAASIMNKDYLTAAGSILTVESRHSAYLRSAGLEQSPFPQPFDAPLGLNQVYTLAAPFIASCPEDNAMLPVKAFPSLALESNPMDVKTNASITLKAAEPMKTKDMEYYAAWISVTGPTFTPAHFNEDCMTFMTTVPAGFHGQSYVLITKQNSTVTDDSVVAGPAVVEVMGASGEEMA